MEDTQIINLYFERSEHAIHETQIKYGNLLRSISYGILKSMQDAEECENDTYLKTWNVVPPQKPSVFSAFLSKITRNLSLDRYEYMRAEKRGGGEVPVLIDELAECLADGKDAFEEEEASGIKEVLNSFLGKLKKDQRVIFMRRYWFGDSIQQISDQYGFSTSKIKMSLTRSRKGLRAVLEKEGYTR